MESEFARRVVRPGWSSSGCSRRDVKDRDQTHCTHQKAAFVSSERPLSEKDISKHRRKCRNGLFLWVPGSSRWVTGVDATQLLDEKARRTPLPLSVLGHDLVER